MQSDHSATLDPVKLSRALMDAYDKSIPIFQKYWSEHGEHLNDATSDPLNVREAWMTYMEHMAENPGYVIEQNIKFWQDWTNLCAESTKKFMGEDGKTIIEPDAGDRRFKADEWQDSTVFDFIKQSYLLTANWMENTVRSADNLDDQTKEKLAFSARLFAGALSPSNFVMTNPEVLKETVETGGENLIRGLENLTRDLSRGDGELSILTTDHDAFTLGENIATTPGSVVFENDLMQLIQYAPRTDKAFKHPLLIVPPWINKYYILDLRAENSFVQWALDQGHSVFVISWVNPDRTLAQKRFEDYMSEGVLSALDQITGITGEESCNAIGYCLGGTLLATTLAYLKAQDQQDRIASATFFTTLLDFEHAGEMKLFMDDAQIDLMNRQMAESGVLHGKELQRTFSLLRANDLIWSFVVNNYLMGKENFPFDLLYWNDDATNMPAAMHSFYLRKMYRDNLLIETNGVSMKDTGIDISQIETPCYFLSTREDHIAPWQATYAGSKVLGSGVEETDITFTLAASGHIAGVVNPPHKNKYCYWTSNNRNGNAQEWMDSTQQHDGSWWPHWQSWIEKRSRDTVDARAVDNSRAIEAAPGRYVKKQA